MTALIGGSQHSERSGGSQLPTQDVSMTRYTADLACAMSALRRYRAREAFEKVEGHAALVEGPSSSSAPRGSRYRHPSSARYQDAQSESRLSRCGSSPITVAEAPYAIRRVVILAARLLGGDPDQPPPKSQGAFSKRLRRVARLRDELHVTTNRIARFGYEEHPLVDPVQITAPSTSNAELAPAHLLSQLDLTATRLAEQLESLSTADWERTGRIGNQVVTLGELVEAVVQTAIHDLVDLLQVSAPDGP